MDLLRSQSRRHMHSWPNDADAPTITPWLPSAHPRTTAGLAMGGRALAAASAASLYSVRPEAWTAS
eukprot:16103603-Heterocapsa_arctica.AAC.1